MTGSHSHRLGGASLGKLIVSPRFGTSARQVENGFMPGRIVSLPRGDETFRHEISAI
jgi:hypothetical protein